MIRHDWRFHLREHRGAYGAAAMFVVDLRAVHRQAPVGLDGAGAHHRGQQGRAAGDRRDGADAAGADLGHRSVGRHGVRAGQLPGLAPGGRHAAAGRARRAWRCSPPARCAASSTALIIVYRPPAADHHHAGHRHGVLRPRAGLAAGAGRRRAGRPGRRAHRRAAGRHAVDAAGADRGGRAGVGAVPRDRRSAARPWPSARPKARPTCRACRSAAPRSSPTRWPACWRRSAACC